MLYPVFEYWIHIGKLDSFLAAERSMVNNHDRKDMLSTLYEPNSSLASRKENETFTMVIYKT